MRFLHASDLHLSEAEADYGFAVLEDILRSCRELKAEALVLAGDLFDSYADLEALYRRFRESVEAAGGDFPVLAVAGNHDSLRGPGGLERFDFGPRLSFATSSPLRSMAGRGADPCEFILLPYGSEARGAAPPREEGGPPRVVVAHGSLPELNWLGPENEEGEGPRSGLDSHSLLSLEPDYAALGHIHQGQAKAVSGCLFAYPGSARVWRRGEAGPRSALLVSVGGGAPARCEHVALPGAGEYRRIPCPLGDSGAIDEEALEKALEGSSAADWIDLGFIGVAQRELPLRQALESCRASLSAAFRKVDLDADAVAYLGEEGDSGAAREFRQAWKAERQRLEEAYGREAALNALRIGLSAIARAQEAAR